MKILTIESIDEIAKLASTAIIDAAKEIAKTKEFVTLALPGGRSVKKIYEELSKSTDPVWKKIHLFLVDERIVPITDEESNFKLIRDTFGAKLVVKGILSKDNLHPIIIDQNDSHNNNKVIEEYKKTLDQYGGTFDITLVSSGEDGHIAALYPDHNGLKISGKKFIILNDSPKPPKDRITSSIELILSSKFIILLFIDDAKKQAYNNFLNKKIPIIDCPAKIATKINGAVIYTNITNSSYDDKTTDIEDEE